MNCSLLFVGNATMLLRLGGVTLLTDPNFLHKGQYAYLGHGLLTRRRTEPALRIADLPPLDAIVLSHLHGDHWDRVARRELPKDIPVMTTPKAARALARQGFVAAEGLPTWSRSTITRGGDAVTVTALPGRHGNGLARHLLPPVMGSLLDVRGADGSALRLYITGDTLYVADLAGIPQRFPDIDVAALHLGGTRLPGGMIVSMDGRQGAELLELVRPRLAVPVHHDDYRAFASPLADFTAEAARRGVDGSVRVVRRGETLELPVRPAASSGPAS